MGVLNQLSIGLVVLFVMFAAAYLSSMAYPTPLDPKMTEPVRNIALGVLAAALVVGYGVSQYEPECKR